MMMRIIKMNYMISITLLTKKNKEIITLIIISMKIIWINLLIIHRDLSLLPFKLLYLSKEVLLLQRKIAKQWLFKIKVATKKKVTTDKNKIKATYPIKTIYPLLQTVTRIMILMNKISWKLFMTQFLIATMIPILSNTMNLNHDFP